MSPQQPPHTVLRETVASAVASLTRWMKKRAEEARPNLLADERDDLVVLQLSLRRVPASRSTRPRLLPLPHPVVGHDGASVCVISDDRPKSRSPSASDLLHASKSLHRLPVSEVIPLSTLRTDYRPYESRRRLAASHDLFVADRAILPLLPRVLGKAFYSTKKAPIGVDFTRVGWPEQVRKVLGSALLYLRSGTCSGIKVGRLDMEEEEIVDNVMAAVAAAVEKVPKKWANVRALHLKAVDSVALPIYQVVPELGMKIEVPEIVGSGEVIGAAEAETHGKKIDKKKTNAGASGSVVFGNIRDKTKKKKKEEQIEEDVVIKEEVQVETEKKKRKSTVVSADDSQKVDKKKGEEKGKRGLENENEAKEANLGNKKIKKRKTEEGKRKKQKSMKGDGEVSTDEIQEDKKIKGEKSGGKTKKLRTREAMETMCVEHVADGHKPMTSVETVPKVLCLSHGQVHSEGSGNTQILKNAGILTTSETSIEIMLREQLVAEQETNANLVKKFGELKRKEAENQKEFEEYKRQQQEELKKLREDIMHLSSSGNS